MSGYQGKKNIPRITVSIVKLFTTDHPIQPKWLLFFSFFNVPRRVFRIRSKASQTLSRRVHSVQRTLPPRMNIANQPAGWWKALAMNKY